MTPEEIIIKILTSNTSGPKIRAELRDALEEWVEDEGNDGGGGGGGSAPFAIYGVNGSDSPHTIELTEINTYIQTQNTVGAPNPGHLIYLPCGDDVPAGSTVIIQRSGSDSGGTLAILTVDMAEEVDGGSVMQALAGNYDAVTLLYLGTGNGWIAVSKRIE